MYLTSTPVIKAVDATGGTKNLLSISLIQPCKSLRQKNMNQYETCKTASKYKKGAVSADYPFFFFPNPFVKLDISSPTIYMLLS
jgi:hypothetical protein